MHGSEPQEFPQITITIMNASCVFSIHMDNDQTLTKSVKDLKAVESLPVKVICISVSETGTRLWLVMLRQTLCPKGDSAHWIHII